MAMATSSAAANYSPAAQVQMQAQESISLRCCDLVFPALSKCKALSACAYKPSSRRRPNAYLPVRAVATTHESTEKASTGKVTKYHFLVANAKFMLDDEEHFQELMRERLRNFGERNREQDFWLVVEPKFLENFPDIAKRLKRPAVALVSTDELWITYFLCSLSYVFLAEFYTAVYFKFMFYSLFLFLLVRVDLISEILEISWISRQQQFSNILFGPVSPLQIITSFFVPSLLIQIHFFTGYILLAMLPRIPHTCTRNF